jgi:hypothetical protein
MLKKLVILNSFNLTKFEQQENELSIVHLKRRQLGSNEQVPFLFIENKQNLHVYELLSYQPTETSSVFIDNYVQSEAFVYLAFAFNWQYFLIDFVQALNENEFTSIEEFREKFLQNLMIRDSDEMSIRRWACKLQVIQIEYLNRLFDCNETSSTIKSFRVSFNSKKCLNWLKGKVELLKEKFVRDSSDREDPNEAAFELICQYVSRDLADKLRNELQPTTTEDELKLKKRKS